MVQKLSQDIFNQLEKYGIVESVKSYSKNSTPAFEAIDYFPLEMRIAGIILGYISQGLKEGRIILKSEQKEAKDES